MSNLSGGATFVAPMGSSENDNMTIRTSEGDIEQITDRDAYTSDPASPFGDGDSGSITDGSMAVKDMFPVLYSIEEEGYSQISSGICAKYEESKSALYAIDVDAYGVILDDGGLRVNLNRTDLNIKEKSFIKIGSGPKIKVTKTMETFFKKLELSTKMKMSHVKEIDELSYNTDTVVAELKKTETMRNQGLIDLQEEFNQVEQLEHLESSSKSMHSRSTYLL